jgi:hypothetical protein
MLLCLLVTLALIQHPHDSATDRAAMTMGFDQDATVHHFYLSAAGGAIEVAVKDPANATDRDAIRMHLRHIASMFAAGDFAAPMLVHDTKNVPGVTVLSARHDRLTYRYTDDERPNGGRIDITTTDTEALAALHAFLRYQIREHKTGDPLRRPGTR